jgi:hypothetical protein
MIGYGAKFSGDDPMHKKLDLSPAIALILIPAGWIAMAQAPASAPAAAPLHVEGIVLDGATGKPIEGATVGAGKSDAAGHFSVDLRAGSTTLSASKDGYNPGKLQGRALVSNIPGNISVALPADQKWSDLVIQMNPSASVTGKVFDEKGQPMQDADIQAFVYVYSPLGTRYRVKLAGSAVKTNDLGVFRYERLDAGDYYFEIRPSSPELGGDALLAPVFYPNAIDEAHAEAVHVDAGANIQLKTMALLAVHGGNLTVRVVNNTGEENRAGGNFFIGRSNETGFALKSLLIPKEKLFDIQDVGHLPAGKYFVYGGFSTGSPGVAEVRLYFDMTNADLQLDLPVTKYKPINVTGRAVIDDGSSDPRPAAGIRLVFQETGVNSATLNQSISPPTAIVSGTDGTFSLVGTRALNPSIPPYAFRIRPGDLPPGMYIKAIRGIDGDIYKPVQGQDLNLTVLVGSDAGTLEGVVKNPKGAKVPLGIAVLIPDEPNADLRVASATSNSTGTFKIQAAPGAYRLFAWYELIGAPYLNAEFMAKIADKGIAVRIAPNGHATMDVTALEYR